MEKEFRPWRKSELQRVNRITKKDVSTLTVEEADRLLAFCIFTKKLLVKLDNRAVPVMDTIADTLRIAPVADMYVDTLRNARNFFERIYGTSEKGNFVYAIPNTIFVETDHFDNTFADTSGFIETVYGIWQNETIPIIQKCFDKYDSLRKMKNDLFPHYVYIPDKERIITRNIPYICADCFSRLAKGMPVLYYETSLMQKFSPVEYRSAPTVNEKFSTDKSINQRLDGIVNREEWNHKLFFVGSRFPFSVVSFTDKQTLRDGRDSKFLLFSEPQYHDDIGTVLSLNYDYVLKRVIDNLLRNGAKCDADEFNSRKILFCRKAFINTDPCMHVYMVKIREKGAFLYIAVYDDYDKFFKMPVDPKYPLDPRMQLIFPAIDRALYLEKQKNYFVEELPDMDMWI